MRLEHHLVGGYVRYISPHIIIIIIHCENVYIAKRGYIVKRGTLQKVVHCERGVRYERVHCERDTL